MHYGEIKEFESKALECLAASQLSCKEVNSIVVSLPFPHSRNQQLLYASTFLPSGDCSAAPGSPEILQDKLSAPRVYRYAPVCPSCQGQWAS